MKTNNFLLRLLSFVVGLFVMAFGVALSVKANMGVSPISCIPYIYSVKYPLTMGEMTILFNVLLILLQIVVLRRNYRLIQLVQFPVVLVFGFFTDLTLFLVSGMHVSVYGWQVFWCLLGCVVLAFGVFLEVKAGITYLPGEGLAMAISDTFKKEFGKAKIGVDSSMVILGVLSSFILLFHLEGVREGTIVAALLVGYLARLYSRKLSVVDLWLGNQVETETSDKELGAFNQQRLVITISREFGSGGHEIGELVAKELGISFYDKELIEMTAHQSGFTKDYIEQHEQKLANSLLYDLYEQEYAYVNEKKPPLDALFLVQSKIIREISEKEPCVIVGRCANFVLKDMPGCLNVFIHAEDEFRKKRVEEQFGIDPEQTDKIIERMDRERSNYCWHYTGKVWSDSANYHLTLDSSRLGIQESVRMITEALDRVVASQRT